MGRVSRGGTTGYFVLGCLDINSAFAIPYATIHSMVDASNATELEDKIYWHII